MGTDSQKRICFLLVEDDDAHATIFQRVFRKTEVEVDFLRATDGEEALACLKGEAPFLSAKTPDIILLDLKLPKLDGISVLEQIRFDKKLNSIPVVILTTSDSENDKKMAFDLGAKLFISKPASLEDMKAILMHVNTAS